MAGIGLSDLFRNCRAIAGRTARVGREHGIAGGGVELVVGREMRAIGRERPAMDFEDQRHTLALDMAGRQRQPALDRLAENGRASWRERVCQYVWISVVAGSLKRKTTKEQYSR